MQSFKSLIEDIKKNRLLANTEIPHDADARTLTARIGKKKRAKEDLKDLSYQYRNHVKGNCIFILPKGKYSEGFTELANEQFGCFNVGAEDLYNEIADQIHERHYTNCKATPALFDILMSVFNDICDQVGIVEYPVVFFEAKYSRRLKNRDDLLDLIKEAFNDKVGSELVGVYAIDKVAKLAIEKEYEGKTIPIIINTEDKEFSDLLAGSLKALTNNVFSISTAKKQTEEIVKNNLVKIKKSLK